MAPDREADNSSKAKYVVLEYAAISDGRELCERREGHVIRKERYGGGVKLMVIVTRAIDDNVVVYRIKGFADQVDKDTKVDFSGLTSLSFRKFESEWRRLWVTSPPATCAKDATDNMALIRCLVVPPLCPDSEEESEEEFYGCDPRSEAFNVSRLKACLKKELRHSHAALADNVTEALTHNNRKMNKRLMKVENKVKQEISDHGKQMVDILRQQQVRSSLEEKRPAEVVRNVTKIIPQVHEIKKKAD